MWDNFFFHSPYLHTNICTCLKDTSWAINQIFMIDSAVVLFKMIVDHIFKKDDWSSTALGSQLRRRQI